MFDAPAARLSDPETSHEAAQSVAAGGRLRARLEAIGVVLREGPMHDELLIATYARLGRELGLPAQTPQSIRSRRAELVRAGVVVHNGEYVVTKSGRRSRVWKLVVD